VLKAHLDAIEVSLALLKVQTDAMRHALTLASVPAATVVTPRLPERCIGAPEALCALQDEDAMLPRASFENPNGWQCKGCRYIGDTAETGAE
jgi:hypothetical protein